MTSGRGAPIALHLFLVWATTAAVVPPLGFAVVLSAWSGGNGAVVPVFLVGVPLSVFLLAMAGIPARTMVPLCGSPWQRLGWAVLVYGLGTIGVAAGLNAYAGGVDLGSAGTRFALTGVPYAVAAAFFVPSGWVRLGAVAALAAGVAYGGFVGPGQAQQREHEAEVARYREHPELLYLGDAPPGMQVSRADVGPASFGVVYGPVQPDRTAYVGLILRPPITPALRCPEVLLKGETCTVDAHGEMRLARDLPGQHTVTLTRRRRNVEIEVSSWTLGESGLRHLLNTLHPLSDAELEKMMREKTITHRL